MYAFEFDISVNGAHTKTTITANNYFDAKKILEAQYPNCKITIWSYKQVR